MPSDADPEGGEQANFDLVSHLQASYRQPRSARLLGGLLLSALRMTRTASPRLANVNLAVQFSSVLFLALQILFAKLALQALLRESGDGGSIWAVVPSLAALVALTGLGGLALSAQAQLSRLLGETVQRHVRGTILGVTTRVPLETFESPAFFDDLQRVQTNAGMQPMNLSRAMVSLIGGGLGALVLAIVLATIEPLLLPVLAIAAVPQTLLSRKQGSIEFGFIVEQSHGHRVRDYLIEVLTGRDEAKEIRAFDLGGVVERRWADSYARYLADLANHVRRRVKLAMGTALVTFAFTAVTLGLLVAFVVDGSVGLASAGAALIAIRLLAQRVEMTFTGVSQLFEASLFVQDYERFLQRAPERVPQGQADATVPPFRALEARGVGFRYPSSHADVLHDVSMTVRAGEVVALVGENGSGKTTLAKLLCQVYSPTAGTITWDGTPSSDLSAAAMRRNIGVIFQDFARYQLSAWENIGFGRPDAIDDREGIEEAARRGGADPFLSRLPDGYDTLLGKTFWGGYDLSLGQWQRVAISRVFFRGADFLVLDEPTASLDARSEQRLFDQLRELASGRALLLISHRFSSVRAADRIYVLHEGRIVEEGDHDELMAAGGRYAELFSLQAKSYR